MDPSAPLVYQPPPPVARPADAQGWVHLHAAPIPAGASVDVSAGDVCGLYANDQLKATLEAGRHAAPEPCDRAVFVSVGAQQRPFGGPLGTLSDGTGATANVQVSGALALRVGDPASLLRGPLARDPDPERLLGAVHAALLDALRGTLSTALKRGPLGFGDLQDPGSVQELLKGARQSFNNRGAVPGLALATLEATLQVTNLTQPAPPPPPPQPPPPPPVPLQGYAPGAQVMVQWDAQNRYPGVVMQVAQGQVLVAFGNGAQHWIPEPYVSRL